MKKFISLSAVIIAMFFLNGCSNSVNNALTFKNSAAGNLYINFRGSIITVVAGKTVQVKDIPQGTYDYKTTYELPAGTTSSTVVGDVDGTVNLDAGTKILVYYTSSISGNVYSLNASKTDNEDQNKTNPVLF